MASNYEITTECKKCGKISITHYATLERGNLREETLDHFRYTHCDECSGDEREIIEVKDNNWYPKN
jgi:ribosomal protein L32